MKRSALFELKDRGWRACHRAVGQGLSELDYLPLELQPEITTACNLRCTMCTRTWNRTKSRHLPYEILERILAILPSATRLIPFGLGEPLLYPHFMELVERAKASGVTVTFNTNGMLLAPDLGRRFVALGVDAIAFSIDGASRGLFEEIRAGANFRTVVDNIEFLCSERDRRGPGSPQVIVSFVPMKDNVRELPELISLCSRVGVHDLCFESLLAPAPDWNPGYRDYHRDHTLAHVSPDELHDLAERSQELAHEVGVALHPPGFLEGWKREPESPPSEGGPPPALEPISSSGSNDPPPKNHGLECTMPWTTVYVSISGVVQTCCMSARVLGNLGEQTFAEIWNGEAFRSYRREMAERRFPAECATCLSNGRNRLDLPDLLKPRYAWGTSRAGRWRPLVARFVPAPVRRKIGDWLLTRS